MFNVGDIVRYRKEWCSEGERKYLHIIRERRLDPVKNTETRFLIETLNMESMTLRPTGVVDDFMIEKAEV